MSFMDAVRREPRTDATGSTLRASIEEGPQATMPSGLRARTRIRPGEIYPRQNVSYIPGR